MSQDSWGTHLCLPSLVPKSYVPKSWAIAIIVPGVHSHLSCDWSLGMLGQLGKSHLPVFWCMYPVWHFWLLWDPLLITGLDWHQVNHPTASICRPLYHYTKERHWFISRTLAFCDSRDIPGLSHTFSYCPFLFLPLSVIKSFFSLRLSMSSQGGRCQQTRSCRDGHVTIAKPPRHFLSGMPW